MSSKKNMPTTWAPCVPLSSCGRIICWSLKVLLMDVAKTYATLGCGVVDDIDNVARNVDTDVRRRPARRPSEVDGDAIAMLSAAASMSGRTDAMVGGVRRPCPTNDAARRLIASAMDRTIA